MSLWEYTFRMNRAIGQGVETKEKVMEEAIAVTFLDQTGAKSIRAQISPTVIVKKIIPSIITRMALPTTAPDGSPMIYALDHKQMGRRLLETQTLPEAGVKNGDHLIVFPEIVAGLVLSMPS